MFLSFTVSNNTCIFTQIKKPKSGFVFSILDKNQEIKKRIIRQWNEQKNYRSYLRWHWKHSTEKNITGNLTIRWEKNSYKQRKLIGCISVDGEKEVAPGVQAYGCKYLPDRWDFTSWGAENETDDNWSVLN